MRAAVSSFGGRVEQAVAAIDRLADYHSLEVQRFGHLPYLDGRVEGRTRLFDRRQMSSPPRLTRRDLLDCLAEAAFLRRALARAAEPGQHAIFVELLAGGRFETRERFGGGTPGLLEQLAEAYGAARGEVDAHAWAT